MKVYRQVIFPHILDRMMAREVFRNYRQALLADVQGPILEIGFGTGLNLPHYPSHVHQITTVDPNPGMHSLAQKRLKASPIKVEHHTIRGEALPFPDQTFGSVVSTWTLCSIPEVDQALGEIHRVLKPGGRFFFLEHGLSPEVPVQRWQHRLTPLQKCIGDGCHLNRPIAHLVSPWFPTMTLEEFYAPGFPKLGGYFYRGIATKSPSPPFNT